MQFIVIKTKEKVFISTDVKGNGYSGFTLDTYKFDGEFPEPTYDSKWYVVNQIPSKVEKKVLERKINQRYELKEKFKGICPDLALICYASDFFDEDGDITSFGNEYASFYEIKHDIEPEHWENVEFQVNVIEEREQFELVKTEYTLQYNFLDKLNTHPVLLPTKPCKLTLTDSYKVIRNYVKENINPKVARIESDHDFLFKVVKLIHLDEPEPYEFDVNAWSSRKKKPKYETRYRLNREVKIFSMSNDKGKTYQGQPLPPVFEGTSYENLMENIKKYLDDLMAIINEEIVDCPHCKGHGIIVKTANTKGE